MKRNPFVGLVAVGLSALSACHPLTGQESGRADSDAYRASDPWAPYPLLPGAHYLDVTRPPFHAVPDDEGDDTAAIQAALRLAASRQGTSTGTRQTLQQMVYLPAGTYLVSKPLVFPRNLTNQNHQGQEITDSESYQWLRGAGADRTIIRLRSREDMGLFATKEKPEPVVQTARYAFDQKQNGNSKFQLWVTDLSIVVPDDQPHAVGLSFGVANMGGVRRVRLRAEGQGGHTGLALVQNNNGPGLIKRVHVEGFRNGIEINDSTGKNFTLQEVTIANQQPGGIALAIADKGVMVENLEIRQEHPDVAGIHLRESRGPAAWTPSYPHLTLLGADFRNTSPDGATAPAIQLDLGHLYLRGAAFSGYGEKPILDHGQRRTSEGGELVLVHGKSVAERPNVAVAVGDAPTRSLGLEVKPAPALPERAWRALDAGDFTRLDTTTLEENPTPAVSTDWVVVEASGTGDDTSLVQAALDSGARYVGLLDAPAFVLRDTIEVNAPGTPGTVELIYGHMTDLVFQGEMLTRAAPFTEPNEFTALHLHTGKHPHLFIEGLRIDSHPQGRDWQAEDFAVFRNDAACTLVLRDVRAKCGPRHYRNGPESEGQEVYFDLVEFAYSKVFPQECVVIRNQKAWARSFNVEMGIKAREATFEDEEGRKHHFNSLSTVPRIINEGGVLFATGQKVGEHNGPFFLTRSGGRTEILSVFFNQAGHPLLPPTRDAALVIVEGRNSACSLVGFERTRQKPFPHDNTFAVIDTPEFQGVLEGTAFPTHIRHDGFDPFEDADPARYRDKGISRVFGLFRVGE